MPESVGIVILRYSKMFLRRRIIHEVTIFMPPFSYDRPSPRWFWLLSWVLFVAVLVFVTYESLEPTPPSADITHADKVMHLLAYGLLTGLFALAMPRIKLFSVFLWPSVYGAVIEVAQALMPYGRTGSLWDLLANMTGTLCAVLGWVLLIRLARRRR